MSETYMAVWGMGSLILAFVAVCLCAIAAIWNLEIVGKVMASLAVISLFSLVAALFVQLSIDRQRTDPPAQSTNSRS